MSLMILWVEDRDEEIGSVLTRLNNSGHSVDHVKGGTEAQAFLEKRQYDAVILDQRIENESLESGAELFRALREGRYGDWCRDVPVVFATGYADSVRRTIEGVIPPPCRLLTKPLARDDSYETIVESIFSCIDAKTIDLLTPEQLVVGEEFEIKLAIRKTDVLSRMVWEQSDRKTSMFVRACVVGCSPEGGVAGALEAKGTEELEWIGRFVAREHGTQLVEVEIYHMGNRVGYLTSEVKIVD